MCFLYKLGYVSKNLFSDNVIKEILKICEAERFSNIAIEGFNKK